VSKEVGNNYSLSLRSLFFLKCFIFAFQGKNRSAADKAKIAAGVRARNRAILLEKLEKMGMTEEEWFQKKKLLKYLRERVRRAKQAKDVKAVKLHQQSLDTALAEQGRATVQSSQAQEEQPTLVTDKSKKPKTQPSLQDEETPPKTDDSDPEIGAAQDPASIIASASEPLLQSPDESTAAPEGVMLSQVFARDIHWTHHHFDQSELDSPYEVCPNNGPGGLICCADCTKQYSNFLTLTAKDIEEQKTHKVIKEVKELMEFLNSAKTKLGDGIQRAKQRTGTRGPLHRVVDKPRFVTQSRIPQSAKAAAAKPPPRPSTKAPKTQQLSNSRPKPPPQSNRKQQVSMKEHQKEALPPPNDDGSLSPIGAFHLFADAPMLALGVEHQQLDDDKPEATEVVAV
jgi:hypothetical protein